MEIKNLGALNYTPKLVLGRIENPEVKTSASTLKNLDSLNLKYTVIKPEEPKKSSGNALSGLGEKLFNNPVLDKFKSYQDEPEFKPVIAKVSLTGQSNASIDDLKAAALKEIKEKYPSMEPGEAASMAYKSVMSYAVSSKYSDPNYFNGEKDKVFHYFTSGSLALSLYNTIPLLPHKPKAWLAGNIILGIGFLKEVFSIPGNGYGHDDMQANRDGIKNAFADVEKLQNNA